MYGTLTWLFLLILTLPFLGCGGPETFPNGDLGDEIGGTETGNPPSCLTVVEDCEDLDEDGICDDSETTDVCDDVECDQFNDDGGTDTGNPANDGGTDTGNPENEDDGTDEGTDTGCLKVTPEF